VAGYRGLLPLEITPLAPRLMLRGTHGGIFGWYPPQLGTPPIALGALRDELVEQLYAAAKLFRTTSLQSSTV